MRRSRVVLLLLTVICIGCGGGGNRASLPAAPLALPPGNYEGDLAVASDTSVISKATVRATIDAGDNLSGTIAYDDGAASRTGSISGYAVFTKEWRTIMPLPILLISYGTGTAPESHTLVFEPPVQTSDGPVAIGHLDRDAYSDRIDPSAIEEISISPLATSKKTNSDWPKPKE